MKKYAAIFLLLIACLRASPGRAQAPAGDQLHLVPETADLDIRFFATNWGMQDSWDSFCAWVRDAGYHGVETWLPKSRAAREEMFKAFEKYDLQFIFLSSGSGPDFDSYLKNFEENLRKAASFHPVLVNCHTGKDYFSFEENKSLIDAATAISKEAGVPVVHETHRGRFSFAAHITRRFLEKIPDLRLTLDISHWCNVHESMLKDQEESVAMALSRTDHIHTRVGHPEGPQVNDPRAPEWEGVLARHLEWWDAVVAAKVKRGDTLLTVTPEFGPPDYMPTLPYTRQAVSDQWDINVYMMNLLKARYGKDQ